ncbi:MAG: endolytic transglycosylase MltG, partial [Streptococcaceae bacterium]|nr:endolytic transglycosylase MltG [Streptococcaceae bacterium]
KNNEARLRPQTQANSKTSEQVRARRSESKGIKAAYTSSNKGKKSKEKEQAQVPKQTKTPSNRRRGKKEDDKAGKNKEFDVRDKEDKIVSNIVKVIVGVLVLLLIVVGVTGYSWFTSSTQPLDKNNHTYISVNIPIGSSNKQIGGILHKAKVIKNGTVFNYYTKFHNLTNFQSGYYNFQPSMTLDQIAHELQKGGTETPQLPSLGKITIPEGYTIDQIAEAMTVNMATKKGEKTPFSKDEFIKLMKSDTFFKKMLAKYPEMLDSAAKAKGTRYRLEGYLFPATYDYSKETTVEALAEQMLATMNSNLQPYLLQIKAKGLSLQEILSLASYIEKEGATEADRRNIAQVFYNRLAINMPLQTNISVLYAEGRLGGKITANDDKMINTKIKSPYNLYTNTGFGPGPVGSPSIDSIEAAVDPKANDYLYFVADPKTGKVYFSTTIEEHDQNVAKYIG